MILISKFFCRDKLDDIVNEYNKTIKLKPVDVNSSIDIDFNQENDKECPKFKVGNYVRISRY